MSSRRRWVNAIVATGFITGGVMINSSSVDAGVKQKTAARFLKNAKQGTPKFKKAGNLSFGPNGLLLVVDGDSVVAIDTGDRGPLKKLKAPVKDVANALAAASGARSVKVVDLAVNPLSGTVYFSVSRQPGNQPAILTVDGDGQVGTLGGSKLAYSRVTLPSEEGTRVGRITGVGFAGERILAAGQSSGAFASKIYSIPVPVNHGASADIFSAETYHVSHRRWETRAPIQAFIPFREKDKEYIVGSFACTPIAKFPIDDLKSGAKVKGESVVELGSGNRPLDMFTYEKDGKRWVVTNTQRFHKNLFGPSKYWGVRLDMSYLTNGKINEKAARRNTKENSGPDGMEVVEALFGVVHVDKLNNNEMVVLREDGGKLNLELAPLP
ncbi:MAG: hypothetical protein HON53_10810 [Planctomycetaceae bacterium]|nr:hypothetical protein [Planctomycetaceae bacterium]MBT6153883.1 hypothetical protein [Planctomycetaceae bacterium]MBT6486646.1 hypothetical protein [Planctomycetaceae bacterium]MBT6494284.1 hypothetical protein [Planctomycetaceae bacterium]